MYDLKDVRVKVIFAAKYGELEELIDAYISKNTSYQFIDIKYQMSSKLVGFSAMIIYAK